MEGNINDWVWVKLTNDGIRVHTEHYEELAKHTKAEIDPKDQVPQIDKRGYTRYQMWGLMCIFGTSIIAIDVFQDGIVYFSEPLA